MAAAKNTSRFGEDSACMCKTVNIVNRGSKLGGMQEDNFNQAITNASKVWAPASIRKRPLCYGDACIDHMANQGVVERHAPCLCFTAFIYAIWICHSDI